MFHRRIRLLDKRELVASHVGFLGVITDELPHICPIEVLGWIPESRVVPLLKGQFFQHQASVVP